MTTRRRILLGGAAWGFAHCALAQKHLPRVGVLSPRPLSDSSYAPSLILGLAELGYKSGATMMLDYRSADGRVERYPPLARELIDQQCDVIFTLGTEPTIPFCDVGYPRPVVFLAVDADPLDRKLVTGLRSPGVNATGVYIPHNALVGKRLE